VGIDDVGPAYDLQGPGGELLLHGACEQLSVSGGSDLGSGHVHTANVAKLAVFKDEEVFLGGDLFQALDGARAKVIDDVCVCLEHAY